MSRAWLSLIILAVLLVSLPTASARTDAERAEGCAFPAYELVCDVALDASFGRAFPGWADVAMAVLFDVALGALVVGIVWLGRHLKPSRVLKVRLGERVKEVAPGGAVAFEFDVENLVKNTPVEVLVEQPTLPGYWGVDLLPRVELESGFLVPRTVRRTAGLHLAARGRDGNRARVKVSFTAPRETNYEETLEYVLRLVPVVRGRVRKRKAKTVKATVLVTPEMTNVEITQVEHSPRRLSPGVPVLTRAHVANRGNLPAPNVDVVFLLNGSEVARRSLRSLPANGEQDVEFQWTPKAGENKIRLAVQ